MPLNLDDVRAEYPFIPKTFLLDGVNMSYIDEGSKSNHPIVMIHGNPTWSFYYRKLALALGGVYRIVAPDHIGCGLSDKPRKYDYTLATHIDNLEKLIAKLNLKKMTLMMHDWGGAIGMGYATRNPETVSSLIIFNTAAFRSQRIPLRISACRIPFAGPLMVRGLNAFARAAIDLRMATAKPDRFTPIVKKGYLGPYDSWRNRIAIQRFVEDIPMKPEHRSYETLKSIEEKLALFSNTPALLIWGMRDFCFDHSFLEEWLRRLKNVEAHMFEDAGHYVVEDAWERITPLAKAFLGRAL